MNETRRIIYHGLTLSVLIVIYVLRVLPFGGPQIWTAFLAVTCPYNGFKATIVFLVVESFFFSMYVTGVPVASSAFALMPLRFFFSMMTFSLLVCFVSFIAFYFISELVGIRKLCNRVFP